jgi:hypothetical protein
MNMENDISVKHVQVRLSSEEHAQLQKLAGGSRQLQGFVRQVIQNAIGSRKHAAYRAENLAWHALLEEILTRGSDRQKLGIQSNLEAFVGNLPAAPRVEEEEIVYRPKPAKRRAS